MTLDPSVFVHPAALCESDQVGSRTRVWAFAHVLPGAVIGADCNLCDHVFVEGGATIGSNVTIKNAVLLWDKVTIEDNVFIGPGTVFTNDLHPRSKLRTGSAHLMPTLVGRGATIGANVTIVCGVRIGANAFVAAGAVATKDVGDHALMVGNPARQIGWVCECGLTLDGDLACTCGCCYAGMAEGNGIRQITDCGGARSGRSGPGP